MDLDESRVVDEYRVIVIVSRKTICLLPSSKLLIRSLSSEYRNMRPLPQWPWIAVGVLTMDLCNK